MMSGKRVCVVMPAYNAEKTLRQTYAEVDRTVADDVILVDDASRDHTADTARELGLHLVVHPKNRGYGGNQKTCYAEALARAQTSPSCSNPDYQIARLPSAMVGMAASDTSTSRWARESSASRAAGGMPLWKYVANRLLTAFENLPWATKPEYHTTRPFATLLETVR
jgi:glycosyltransferase involved in cell wall biosynthesis